MGRRSASARRRGLESTVISSHSVTEWAWSAAYSWPARYAGSPKAVISLARSVSESADQDGRLVATRLAFIERPILPSAIRRLGSAVKSWLDLFRRAPFGA